MSETATTETTTSTDATRGRAGESFVGGESLYLRGLGLVVATRAGAWLDSRFPIRKKRAGEIIA